ncbi:hypothetical protein [Paenibacillus peoriae]|uniref:hypothetical protein n=1 Tax=Paenibacillus peoriae TaxID=59893 RepID=UPI002116B566|nr:hypothetical protein [Paenibacillus peoriae]
MGVKIDRRILKTKAAIFNAFIGLISEKDFEEILLMRLRIERMLTGEPFIFTTPINTIFLTNASMSI